MNRMLASCLLLLVGIGVAAEAAFLGYVVYFGRKAARAGETGDIDNAPDLVPTG